MSSTAVYSRGQVTVCLVDLVKVIPNVQDISYERVQRAFVGNLVNRRECVEIGYEPKVVEELGNVRSFASLTSVVVVIHTSNFDAPDSFYVRKDTH